MLDVAGNSRAELRGKSQSCLAARSFDPRRSFRRSAVHGIWNVLRVISAVLLLTGSAVPAVAQQHDAALVDRLLHGIRDGSRKAERVSFRVAVIGRIENTAVSEQTRASFAKNKLDPHDLTEHKFDVAIRGPFCLQRMQNKDGTEVLKVRNGSYAFAISRRSNSRPTLQFLEAVGGNPRTDSMVAAVERQVRGAAFEGFHLWGIPLVQIVQSKGFKLKRAFATAADGRELVRAEFDLEFNDPRLNSHFSLSDAYVVCDPSRQWALVEAGGRRHTYVNKTTEDLRITFAYGDSVAGIPVANSIETIATFPDDPGTEEKMVHSIEVTSADEVPEEEFFLTHYGLPEPNMARNWIGPWVWYLAAGSICLAIGAVVIKRRNSRW